MFSASPWENRENGKTNKVSIKRRFFMVVIFLYKQY
jgi:hypothetical protein